MKFKILQPGAVKDPRDLSLRSIDHLLETIPQVAEERVEEDVVAHVRDICPDAVAMPFPVEVGSGKIWLLGFVENAHVRINPDDTIAFVLFVAAIAETDMDRTRFRKGPPFDRKKWRLLPVVPSGLGVTKHRAQLRSTDLEFPVEVDVTAGFRGRQLTLYLELGGVAMSLGFYDETLTLKPGSRAPEPAPALYSKAWGPVEE